MNKKSHFLLLSSLALMALSSCGGGQAPGSSTESSVESDPDDGKTVSVFVLSGQSNMEGSTFYDNGHDYLRAAGEALEVDVEPAFEGIEGVQTSFYGYYPYQGWGQDAWKNITPHCSNTESPLDGKFEATKVGMGNRDDLMGPEVGLSLGLKDHRKNSRPIFFIKCAFSGSGFTSQNPTWKTHEQGTEDQLFDRLLLYTHNNLGLIEGMGYKPVIKGFLWHQGESDANNDSAATGYLDNLRHLVGEFREEFKDYAVEGNGDNINFVDALIYDGTRLTYGSVDKLNDSKLAFAEEGDHNFCINTSMKREGGLQLQIGGGSQNSDVEGCFNIYHYITKDMLRLGLAYADVVLENGMLD